MNSILNNIRRIFVDNGQNDRDFTDQEKRLQTARSGLLAEAEALKNAANKLADLIRLRSP